MSLLQDLETTEGNRRRSLRQKIPRIEWDSNQTTTDDDKKVANSSQRSMGKKGNSKGLYGFSRSSVAGLRKLQRRQLVKGPDLLARMTERRNKISKGLGGKTYQRQRREKVEDLTAIKGGNRVGGSNGGFTIPLSILNNIPDVGLCPLESDSRKRQRRQRAKNSVEPVLPVGAAKSLIDSSSSSSSSPAGSDSSSTDTVLTKRRFKNSRKNLSPEVALQNEVNSPNCSRSPNGVNAALQENEKTLLSWEQDCSHNSTQAPILWALDNMADKLNEDIEWMMKARAISSKWKRIPTSAKIQYIDKAKANQKVTLCKNQSALSETKNTGISSLGRVPINDTSLKLPCTNISKNNKSVSESDSVMNHSSAAAISSEHSLVNTTKSSFLHQSKSNNPSIVSMALQPTTFYGNGGMNILSSTAQQQFTSDQSTIDVLPMPLQAFLLSNVSTAVSTLPLAKPDSSSIHSTHNSTTASDKLKSSPVCPLINTLAFSSSSANSVKLLAAVPFTMGTESKVKSFSNQSHGIPIEKIQNPLFPSVSDAQSCFDGTVSPIATQSVGNRSFSISNILANTTANSVNSSSNNTAVVTTSTVMSNSSLVLTNKTKKRGRRHSPYFISDDHPPNSVSLKSSNAVNNTIAGSLVHSKLVPTSNTSSSAVEILQASVTSSSSVIPTTLKTLTSGTTATTAASPTCSVSNSASVSTTSGSSSSASSTPCADGSNRMLTVVTDEWKRLLEKQLRDSKLIKTENSLTTGNNKLACKIMNVPNKNKKKRSNVLSRPPMRVTTSSLSSPPVMFIPPIPASSQDFFPISPVVPLNLSVNQKSLPPSPLTSPHSIRPSSPLVGNALKLSSGQFPMQNPLLRANSPVLFVPQLASTTPSPASTPSMISGEVMNQLKASVCDLRNKVEKLTPEEQVKVDARNYADLERQYWRSLLAIEDQKRIITDLKERMVKARAEQQILLLGDERFNNLKEMIVNPIWEPIVPDLLDTLEASRITTEVRLKGSFDKPVLENEDVYKYLLHSLS